MSEDSMPDLDEEQKAYRARMIAAIEERVAEVFASSGKVRYDRDGMREALGPGAELVVERVNEDGSVTCSVRLSAPIDCMVITSTPTVPMIGVGGAPACHPMAPCGCHGCAVCNGAQAPLYGATTPALGVPVAASCTRYNPCGQYDCKKCFPGQILPPDMRGSKKPNGGGSQATRAANAERGYRVCSYSDWLHATNGERPGERFSTPDLATQRARRDAKSCKETYLVLRDGARWKLLKADGDEVVIG